MPHDSTTYDRNAARVKRHVAEGSSVREIARDLDCSTSTALRCRNKAQSDLNVSREDS